MGGGLRLAALAALSSGIARLTIFLVQFPDAAASWISTVRGSAFPE